MSLKITQTKNKKKKKEKVDEDNVLDNIFADLDLKIFCPKKVFDIIFIAEDNDTSRRTLTNLIESVKKYEELSCVTFITREDTLKILDDFDVDVFPSSFQSCLDEIHEGIKKKYSQNQSSSLWLAQLIKLKLVEVMSRHFLKEISKMENRNILENELGLLAQDSKKGPTIKVETKTVLNTNLGEKKSRAKLDAKSSLGNDVGYKLIETSSDIVFDDDIFNHVWFYVFQGFLDAELLNQLDTFNIPIRALIKFQCNIQEGITNENKSSTAQQLFWNKIPDYFDGPKRSTNLENTILMKFKATQNGTKETFEELLYVIKNISDIKLRHLDYIRHIEIHRGEENYKFLPLECLLTYNCASDQVPIELTNETTVFIYLLKEISARIGAGVDDIWKTTPSQSISITQCKNPCDFNEILETVHVQRNTFSKPRNSFMMHESDTLSIILKTYRSCGPMLVGDINTILRILKPFNLLRNIEIPCDDFIHKHDVDPSNRFQRFFSKSQLHFLYLLLFSTFKHKDVIEEFEDTALTENLQTYSRALFHRSSQPRVDDDHTDYEEFHVNSYDPSPMTFIWKEVLHSQVMVQEIWKNQQLFQYMDIKYSPETDNLLVQFSDHLDAFGINTKTHDVTLRTPVCLRDFCKYVTVDESKWLEENKPAKFVRKSEDIEECEGAKKIQRLDLFQEYRHLLDPKLKPDGDTEETQLNEEENTVTFEQMVEKIQSYPPNTKLIEECGKEHDKTFLAYDFGTKYFAVRGTDTVFSSHDGVKIRVDNTRFLNEEQKCTVSLTSEGNKLILHSNKAYLERDYTFHWNLEDGSIISFVLQDHQRKAKKISITPSNIDLPEEGIGEADEDGTWLQNVLNQKVINLSKADFQDDLRMEDSSQIDSPSDEDFSNIFSCLKQAIEEDYPVYKINNNLTYLTKLNNKIEIPLTNIIRRLLHNTKKDVPLESYTKRLISSTNDRGLILKKSIDFRVCLPNGLYITCYPSNMRDSLVEIKQEFVSREERTEEFRLFGREGYILVKKIDGTLTLLKSNGEIITFEKPDSQNTIIRESNLKTCHCKNLDDYRKKLNKILKDPSDDKFYISRRDFFKTKKGYIINKDIAGILENNKVPYLRTTLLSFDGNRTTLEKNKVTQKRVYHTTSEQDFLTEEMYFEREDGFQCTFDKNGSQVVRFTDGTKISSSMRVSKELVDGYVFISLEFRYDHPDYVSVTYDFKDNLGLCLKDATLERNVKDEINIKIKDEMTTIVDNDKVIFEKVCKKCDSKYSCSFNIHPFVSKHLDYTSQFLHAQDSYDKHFYVDFGGNSTRNKSFLKGLLNRSGCNHYINNVYKKLFIVNRTFAGEQFCTNDMVMIKKNREENEVGCEVIQKSDIMNELPTLEFRKQIFDSIATKFTNTWLLKDETCLSKYKKNRNKDPLYSTIRVFKKMFDTETTKHFLTNLSVQFNEKNNTNESEEAIQDVIRKNDEYVTADVKTLRNLRKKQAEIIPDDFLKICKCSKRKKSIKDKISCWKSECKKFKDLIRKKQIPLYFNSQFCEIIE